MQCAAISGLGKLCHVTKSFYVTVSNLWVCANHPIVVITVVYVTDLVPDFYRSFKMIGRLPPPPPLASATVSKGAKEHSYCTLKLGESQGIPNPPVNIPTFGRALNDSSH